MNARRFAQWIGKVHLLPPGADSFELWHVSREVGEALVSRLDSSAEGDELPRSLEREALEAARGHAEGFEGTQRYAVRARAGDQQLGEFAFRVLSTALTTSSAQTLADPIPEEQSIAGADMPKAIAMMVVQQMRHNEALTRTMMEMCARSNEQLARENASLRRHQDAAEDRRINSIELMETMLSDQHKRELETREAESRHARRERLWSTLEQRVMPALAKRWGFPLPQPGDDKRDVTKVARIFMSLPDDMGHAILEALDEGDREALLEIFASYAPAAGGAESDVH